jgi:O-antigen/teichoic acid export membrane protein
MPDSLKTSTLRAVLWSFLESFVLRISQFIIGILLARILFPEQFGLIGMLMIFMEIAQTLMYGGFNSALIQKKHVTQTDICSVFYLNIVVGVLTSGLFCLIAPWIAEFYKQPILKNMLRLLSITIVINSFSIVHTAILTKEINFKLMTKVSLISNTVSGIIAVLLSIYGFGVWSLVIQQIAASVLRTISYWCFYSWRPSLVCNVNALKEMFGFGSNLLFSNLLDTAFKNVYALVIGKLFSVRDVGFFTRAKTLQEISSMDVVLWRVTFPVFSKMQDDTKKMKRGMKKALTGTALVYFPMMVGLAVIAHPLIVSLLTEKWVQSVPYFRLFCFAGLLVPINTFNMNMLIALGKSGIFLRNGIISKILVVIAITITWRYGIIYIIYGFIVTEIISCYINCYYTKFLVDYSMLEQLQDCFSCLVISLIMGCIVYIVGLLSFASVHFMLAAQIITGVVVYISICRLFKLKAFMEILEDNLVKLLYFGKT